MEKKLILGTSPILCYPHHSEYLSTIMTNDYDIEAILKNYIQLVYNKNIDRMDFSFGIDIYTYINNYSMVDKFCYSKDIINSGFLSLCDFIKKNIDEGYYVCFLLDTYYVNAYHKSNNGMHKFHNPMIYGYDETGFWAADHFMEGKFSYDKISYKEIEDSKIREEDYDWLYGIHTWKLRNDMYMGIDLDVKSIKRYLHDYLKGKESCSTSLWEKGRRDKNFVYGIEVYRCIKSYVAKTKVNMDERIAYVLYEHTKVMEFLCKRLARHAYINTNSDIFLELEQLANFKKIILNLFLKYNLTKEQYISTQICEILQKCEGYEREIYGKIYSEINGKMYDVGIHNYAYIDLKRNNHTLDYDTKGDWIGKYGKFGYDVVGDKVNIPKQYNYVLCNAIYVTVVRTSGDYRALVREKGYERPVAYLLRDTRFYINIFFEEERTISFYLVDYDRLSRKEKISVIDDENKAIVSVVKVENFDEGVYVSFKLKGKKRICFEKIKGPDVVVSGIFID